MGSNLAGESSFCEGELDPDGVRFKSNRLRHVMIPTHR